MNKTGEELFSLYLKRTSDYLKVDLFEYYDEMKNNKEIIREIEEAVKDVDSFQKKFNDIFEFRFFRTLLYVLIRVTKPGTIVETGVMHGLSSKFILNALRKNNNGKLISVDLPSFFESGPANKDGYNFTLPKGKQPGWITNEDDKKIWELRIGKSLEVLPDVFDKNKEISIFIHDSEHTYETMWSELNLAWPHIKPGGICICDNIESNTSFFDFCLKVGKIPLVLPAPGNDGLMSIRFALIQK